VAKVYSEKEAAEILQRAVALQESSQDGENLPETYTPGITDEELRRIAQESGLDLQYLEMAIAAGPPPPPAKKVFLDWNRDHEHVIDGEFPVDKFDMILDEVGPSNGRSMGLRQVGRSIEGQFVRGFGFGKLRLTTRQGRTRLNVRSTSFLPFMVFLYPCLLVGLILGVLLTAFGNIIPGLAILIGAPLIGLLGMRLSQKKAHGDVAKLVDRLVEVISAETEPVAPVKAALDEPAVQNLVE
jgi:hypothetical protein